MALLRDLERPKTLEEVATVAKRAWARAALQSKGNNVKQAAHLVGADRRTLIRAANNNSVFPKSPMWHDGAMHAPFDDQQWPFVRILWPSEPDSAWLEVYKAWILDTIIPRAEAESVKIVGLDNTSALVSLPSLGFLSSLASFTNELAPTADPHVVGSILFAPTLPLGGWIAPVVNAVAATATFKLKVTTTPNAVIGHAANFFTAAGVPVPTELSLD